MQRQYHPLDLLTLLAAFVVLLLTIPNFLGIYLEWNEWISNLFIGVALSSFGWFTYHLRTGLGNRFRFPVFAAVLVCAGLQVGRMTVFRPLRPLPFIYSVDSLTRVRLSRFMGDVNRSAPSEPLDSGKVSADRIAAINALRIQDPYLRNRVFSMRLGDDGQVLLGSISRDGEPENFVALKELRAPSP